MHSIAPDAETASTHSPLLFAAYIERFLSGRRVAVLGDATSGLGAELVSRGARLVHVYDVDASRVARALVTSPARGVTYATLAEDLGVRDGAFDVVLVPDLGLYRDPSAVLARARQTLSAHGVLIAATPREVADGGLGYYEFYDALSLQFAEVRMLGGVPFEGFALVDFSAEGEPSLSVDTSLAEASPREPAFFVAVASHRPVEIDSFVIVQLPESRERRADPREVEDARMQMAELHARMEVTRNEIESLREQRLSAESRAAEEHRRVAELTDAISLAEPAIRQLEGRYELETRRAEALAARLLEAENALARMAAEIRARTEAASQATRALSEHQTELRRVLAREQGAMRRISELEAAPKGVDPNAYEALRTQALMLAEKLAHAESSHDDSHGAEVSAAEEALRERAREIAALRHEVDRRGAMVKELLAALEEAGAQAAGGPGSIDRNREIASLHTAQSEALAKLRQREGDVESLRSRVRELEQAAREVVVAPPPAPVEAPPAAPANEHADVIALRGENDALRRALLQEHEARMRAEGATPEPDAFASVLVEQAKS